MLDLKEKEKKQRIADKIAKEKEMRDAQLKKTEHKRRKEARENMDKDL